MCEACHLSRRAFLGGAALAAVSLSARAEGARPIEPSLRLPASAAVPRVALTLDACPGAFDTRIANALVELGVPATLFLTGTWIAQNREGLAFVKAHLDLFAIENHGARHLAPVLDDKPLFGVLPAGDLAGVRREVEGGAAAIRSATGVNPTWYRGATGFYSREAIPPIEAMGFGIGGYSLNADLGASLGTAQVADRIAGARDGDVIVAHFNQPRRASGAGVVEGVRRLRDRGVEFVRLPSKLAGGAA